MTITNLIISTCDRIHDWRPRAKRVYTDRNIIDYTGDLLTREVKSMLTSANTTHAVEYIGATFRIDFSEARPRVLFLSRCEGQVVDGVADNWTGNFIDIIPRTPEGLEDFILHEIDNATPTLTATPDIDTTTPPTK